MFWRGRTEELEKDNDNSPLCILLDDRYFPKVGALVVGALEMGVLEVGAL